MRRIAIIGSLALAIGGCEVAPIRVEQASLTVPSAVDKYGLGWVKADDGQNPFVIRVDAVIDAPIDVVWSLVRDPNHYQDFNRALTAGVGKMEIGQPISLDIRMFGDPLPSNSVETVDIFDESLHVLSWTRDFGLSQFSHRPQFLEPEGSKTHYYTALLLPESFGWLVMATVGGGIHDAFARFASGLNAAAGAGK